MKKKIITAFVIFSCTTISLCFYAANSWHAYKQEYPPIAFKYPKSFGQPEIYLDKTKAKWEVSFSNGKSGFHINNGFHHIWSEGATLEKYLAHYQVDMDAKNEVKDYKIEYIKIGDFPAVKVKWHALFTDAVTDIFIYQDSTNTSNVIMIQAGEGFVDDTTLEKIVQSLQINSDSFLQHQLLVVPDGIDPSLAASMAMTGELPVMPTEIGDDINGRHLGKIISLPSGTPPTLSIKYAQIPTCTDGDEYCPDPVETIYVPSSSIEKTFPISKNIVVYLQTYGWTSVGNFNSDQVIPFETFREVFDSPIEWNGKGKQDRPSYDPKTRFYWITLIDGEVTEITEQYQP